MFGFPPFRILMLPALAMLGLAAPAAAQDCPAVVFGMSCDQSQHTDPAFAATCPDPSGGVQRLAYDRRAGQLELHDARAGQSLSGTQLWLRDDFVLGGLPSGTPVTIRFRVAASVDITAPCAFYLEFWKDDVPTQILMDGNGSWTGTETVDMSVVAGVPFRLLARAARTVGGSTGSVDLSAVYSFPDLPAGSFITSCAGYGVQPTSARGLRWGELKLLYR